MERKSIWKNFLLLTVGGLLALHLNVSQAADGSSGSSTSTSPTSSSTSGDDCVLEAE